MRAFGISIIIFVIMLLIIIFNYLYVLKTIDNLYTTLQAVPPPTNANCFQQIIAFEQYWNKHSKIIKTSTTASEINFISGSIVKLKLLALDSEVSEFEIVRHQLLKTIYNIKKEEKLSLENII